MHILFVSNIYPPAYLGGYELACRDVVERLAGQGHEVTVLTSTYKSHLASREPNVHRVLEHSFGDYPDGDKPRDLGTVIRGDWFCPRNFMAVRHWVRQCRPDVVYFWCLGQISVSVALAAQLTGAPTAFYIFDRWFLDVLERYMQSPSPAKRAVKTRLLAPLVRRVFFDHVAFGSQFMYDWYAREGIRPEGGRVLYHGLDTGQWQPIEGRPEPREPWRLLFVGQIAPHKGVRVALDALALVEKERRVSLDLVGTGQAHYLREFERAAASLKRTSVRFLGKMSREDLRSVYPRYDAFVFPSVWDEPFGLVVLEAMASGVPVLISRAGGTPEMVTGCPEPCTFERGSAADLAALITRVLSEPGVWPRLRRWGLEHVRSEFSLARTIERTEEFLGQVMATGRSVWHGGRRR